MARVTKELLSNRVDALNRVFARPMAPYTLDETTKHYTPNKGNFHLSEANGGVSLVEMAEGGGVRTVFERGSKALIFDMMGAMMIGADLAKK